jgi:uncharacterized protein (DUF305 family)
MKIEIDKKTGAFIAIVALLFFALGFAMNHEGDDDDHMQGMSGMGKLSSSTLTSAYSSNDLMFAQMMIPHHEQAVTMSTIALSNSTNPKILKLAQQIKDAQAPEIEQMKSWITSSGNSMMGDHGMDMGGMLSNSEIATLKAAKGTAFDRLFLEGMIGHHEGALQMVTMIKNSENQEVKTLAQNIQTSQSAEITLMKSYLAELK